MPRNSSAAEFDLVGELHVTQRGLLAHQSKRRLLELPPTLKVSSCPAITRTRHGQGHQDNHLKRNASSEQGVGFRSWGWAKRKCVRFLGLRLIVQRPCCQDARRRRLVRLGQSCIPAPLDTSCQRRTDGPRRHHAQMRALARNLPGAGGGLLSARSAAYRRSGRAETMGIGGSSIGMARHIYKAGLGTRIR